MIINSIKFELGSKKNLIDKLLEKNSKKVIKTTGISKTYISSRNEDIIKLALKASKKIIKNEKRIDAVILITQTPKYNIPPNSFIIQKYLNLKKNCLVFDINHGCSGFIYGMKIANSLLKSKGINRILLITSDNYSRYLKKLNVKVLFSDCATATLLTKSDNEPKFDFYSDGGKCFSLSQQYTNYDKDVDSNNLIMDGNKVFNFTLSTVPKLISNFLKKNKIKKNEIDFVILHQASKVVNENLIRNIDIDDKKFLSNYETYGNTVSSSIPLLLSENFKKFKNKKILMCGFGVGLSVGTCYYEFK